MLDEQFWKNVPKVFCDNANMAIAEGNGTMFMLALLSGGNAQVFAFTPEHAKRFMQLITHNVKTYENAHGTIDTPEWTPEMKSPFDVKDFKGGNGSSEPKADK